MKRIACTLLAAAASATLGFGTIHAGPAANVDNAAALRTTAADGPQAASRPPAPEVWAFRVEYRSRRGTQFPWGAWRGYTTIRGDYNSAYARANRVADFIDGVSRNYQSRIIETRIR